MLAHSAALFFLLYFRACRLPPAACRLPLHRSSWPPATALAWALMLAAELLGAFLWALSQAFRWRPYAREAFPEQLPGDGLLPALDVFVCTADPEKEPPVGVMNTVVAAMCLDYPAEKLSVYLSDDGGSPLTLFAAREAYSFTAVWLPFCKKHKLPARSPEAYFSARGDGSSRHDPQQRSREFFREKEKVQLRYDEFKQRVNRAAMEGSLPARRRGDDGYPAEVMIGFLYGTVLEDFYTSYRLHCKEWRSAYVYPPAPAFLGTAPTGVHDSLIQNKRWSSGLLELALSRFSPFTYGMLTKNTVLQCLCYASLAFKPLESLVVICHVTIPPLCLLKGIPKFPQATDRWFIVFALVYASTLCQLLRENICNGGSLKTWWNEAGFRIMKHLGANIFATMEVFLKFVGTMEVKFDLTSKVTDEVQVQIYEKGIYDFRGSTFMLLPLAIVALINLAALFGGVTRIIRQGSYSEKFGQFFLSLYVTLITYPVIEAMSIRKDKGRLPASITLWSVLLTMMLLVSFH